MRDDGEDIDIEVTDLAKQQTSRPEHPAVPVASEAEHDGASVAPPAGEGAEMRANGLSLGRQPADAIQRRLVRRWVLAVATGVTAIAVTLALILASMPNPRLAVALLFHSVTATPTSVQPPGPGTLALEHWVPWGTLQVDGRTVDTGSLAVHTLFYDGYVLPRVDLSPGRHSISFRAAQFPSLRCDLSVPAARDDTCPLVTVAHPTDGARALDLGASLDHLSAGARTALLAGVESALAAMFDTQPEVVEPGEWYRTADGSLAQARAPLMATFLYLLNQDATRSAPEYGRACVSICETTINPDLDFSMWRLTAHAVPRWSYRDAASGAVLAAGAPAANKAADPYLDVEVPLHVLWKGQWIVTALTSSTSNPTCAVMITELEMVFGLPVGAPLATYGAHTPAQGCANNTANNFPPPPAYFLYQFGVVVAANAAAHQLRPDMPVGDALQQALAARLVGG